MTAQNIIPTIAMAGSCVPLDTAAVEGLLLKMGGGTIELVVDDTIVGDTIVGDAVVDDAVVDIGARVVVGVSDVDDVSAAHSKISCVFQGEKYELQRI